MEQLAEIISGPKVMGYLENLIATRRVCKLEVPNTRYGWITLLLGIQQMDQSYGLLIDRVSGFEEVFARYPHREVTLEFLEKDGVPCQFKTRVKAFQPKGFLAELPNAVYRMQRRRHFRIKAQSETEILFHLDEAIPEIGKVKDYSLGGVAFLMDRCLQIKIGDQIHQLELRIPQGDQWAIFYIPKAVVRRIERNFPEKDLYALEFREMSEKVIESLWRHIFREQRLLLRRVRNV